MLLAGSLLACPRFMFYDVTLAVLPVLTAYASWQQLSRASRWTLACLAGLLWGGTVISYVQWQMLGPPLETFALIGLWLWAIGASYRIRRAGLSLPETVAESQRAPVAVPA
jgi:hypothetical protein